MKKTIPSVYLAVDLGAGSGRVIAGILDDGKLRLDEIHRFANEGIKLVDTWHWNTTGIFAEIIQGLKKAGDRFGPAVRSVGVDTWGVDYGLLDAAGSLLGLPVQYRDSRTDGIIEKTHARLGAKELFRTTGNQTTFYNTLIQLLAEKERNPGRLSVAEKLLFMPDLVSYWLSGVAVQETTISSTAQLLDARTRDWSRDLIEKLGLPQKLFGTLTRPGTSLGPLLPHIADQTGLQANVVAVGGHDTASAVVAVPSPRENSVYLSSGTWSLLGVLSRDAMVSDRSFDLGFTNEGGVNGEIRLLKNLCGLWLIQECKREWDASGPISWDNLIDEARAAPAFVSLIDPDDPRFAAPGDMPAKLSAYCRETGQPEPTSHGAMSRMIFESLALKYRVEFGKLEELTGRKLGSLHIVGGGCRNALLNQFAADALNRDVIAGPTEATAAGNVMLQMKADGTLAQYTEAALIQNSFGVQTFQPRSPGVWEKILTRFRKLCGEA